MDKKLADLLAQLNAVTQEYEAIVLHLDSAVLNKKTPKGGWSALEIVEHIKNAEFITLNYLDRKTSDFELAPATNLMTYYRYSLLWLALTLPIKFKAPKSLDEPNGPYSASKVIAEWKEQRERLTKFLETYSTQLKGKDVFRHPRAGRMNLNLMLQFMIVHAQRHLKQLKATIV